MAVQQTANHIYFDQFWQEPARTEHCVNQNILELDLADAPCIYIGFPWATYLDFIRKKLADAPICVALRKGLNEIKEHLAQQTRGRRYRIVTACQHIHAHAHIKIFESAGITDLFWSHKPNHRSTLGTVRLHPLPLFSLIQPENLWQNAINPSSTSEINAIIQSKSLLCSFVGAVDLPGYPTDIRRRLCDQLADQPRTKVEARETWHLKREVYEKQISRSPISADLRDRSKEQIYSDTLGQSLFSLCPSGTGPNTIRLWESIHVLSIPVVLSNRWDPPGPQDLWQQCSFRFDERADVNWIWEQLHAASRDHTKLARMIQALIDLRSYYSHNYLAADLATLLLSPASNSPDQSKPAATQPEASYTPFNDPELLPYCTIFFGRHWSAEQLQSPWVDPGCSLHAHYKPILPYALVKQSRLTVELVKRLSWILRQYSPASLLADWQTRLHQVLPPEDAARIGEQPSHEASFAQDLRKLSHTRNAVLVDARHDRGPDASGMKQATLALAMAALPIVHWSPDSPALDYFQAKAVVNLHGLEADAATALIAAFQPTLDHAEAFLETCRFNLKLLRSFRVHSLSRRRLARNLWQQVSSPPCLPSG